MSVRKRTWKTADGKLNDAWIADYRDQGGKRHIKTFDKKKDADAYISQANVEVRQGTHTADSVSVSVARAAELWLTACRQNDLERSTVDAYEQHVRIHIVPFIGRVKLSQLSAPLVREFEDKLRNGMPAPGSQDGSKRSPAMAKKILGSLSIMLGDAQERGLVARNVVRDLRSGRKRGKQRQA